MSGRFLRSLVIALCLAAPGTATGQSFVYLLSDSCGRAGCSQVLTLVDATTGARVRSDNLGNAGFAVRLKISTDGKRLYVLTNPYLSVLDSATRKTLGAVFIGLRNVDVAVLPDGSAAYVSDRDKGVVVVDLTTMTVVTTIQVGAAPGRIVGSPDGKAMYVANTEANTVSKIATPSNIVTATIPVGELPSALDMSPDGTRLFVANAKSASISVVEPASGSTVRTIAAGTDANQPRSVAAASAARAFTTLVSTQDGPPFPNSTVQLLDANNGAVLGQTSVASSSALVRDSQGRNFFLLGARLWRLSSDGVTAVDLGGGGADAAVLEEPCAFAGRASPSVFGPDGGSGTLTIPAASGCAWSFDPSTLPGVTFTQPTSGSGPATLAFTMSPSAAPRYGSAALGVGEVIIEQTIPTMNVDFASGQSLRQPVTIGGWAIDQNQAPLATTGVDRLDVWAYPGTGAAPVFLGNPRLGSDRPDVAAAFGSARYLSSGFNMIVGGLTPGDYTIVFYAHSSRSNLFSSAQGVAISLLPAGPPQGMIESPSASDHVPPAFRISGWAVDPAGSSVERPSGIAAVDIHAYPDDGGFPIAIGRTFPSGARQDIAAYLGPTFLFSGYEFGCAQLRPGSYTLAVFAHRSGFMAYTPYTTRITVDAAAPLVSIDTPKPGAVVSRQFLVGGWALEQSSCSRSGVDLIHVWAFPTDGSAPRVVGSDSGFFGQRPDVAAIFGQQYSNAAFNVAVTLPAGTYDIAVFARSTATQTFSTAKVVRVTVQ